MTGKAYKFNFLASGITEQQAVDLLAQISEWAVANNVRLSAAYSIVDPSNIDLAAVRVSNP